MYQSISATASKWINCLNWFHRLPDNLKGIAYLMLASIVFSLMALIIKLLGQHLHITQILLVRQIGMVVMVAPAILRNFPGSLRTARPKLQLIRVLCALVAMLFGAGMPGILGAALAWGAVILFILGYALFFINPSSSYEKRWRGQAVETPPTLWERVIRRIKGG